MVCSPCVQKLVPQHLEIGRRIVVGVGRTVHPGKAMALRDPVQHSRRDRAPADCPLCWRTRWRRRRRERTASACCATSSAVRQNVAVKSPELLPECADRGFRKRNRAVPEALGVGHDEHAALRTGGRRRHRTFGSEAGCRPSMTTPACLPTATISARPIAPSRNPKRSGLPTSLHAEPCSWLR